MESGQKVAMKAVPCRRPQAVREAEAEAELLMAFRHPHVLRCHDYFREQEEEAVDRKLPPGARLASTIRI